MPPRFDGLDACPLLSVEKIGRMCPDSAEVGDRHETDFVIHDPEGRAFGPPVHNPSCVVCSLNELTPMFAHCEATGIRLEIRDIDETAESAKLHIVIGHTMVPAGVHMSTDSYGRFGMDSRQAYRWIPKRSDELERCVCVPWFNAKTHSWTGHEVIKTAPVENENTSKAGVYNAMEDNAGESIKVFFKSKGKKKPFWVLPNHIDDLGSCLNSWVVEQPTPVSNEREALLAQVLTRSRLMGQDENDAPDGPDMHELLSQTVTDIELSSLGDVLDEVAMSPSSPVSSCIMSPDRVAAMMDHQTGENETAAPPPPQGGETPRPTGASAGLVQLMQLFDAGSP